MAAGEQSVHKGDKGRIKGVEQGDLTITCYGKTKRWKPLMKEFHPGGRGHSPRPMSIK